MLAYCKSSGLPRTVTQNHKRVFKSFLRAMIVVGTPRDYARLPAGGSPHEPLTFLVSKPSRPYVPIAEVIPQLVVIQHHDIRYLSRGAIIGTGPLSARPTDQEGATAS